MSLLPWVSRGPPGGGRPREHDDGPEGGPPPAGPPLYGHLKSFLFRVLGLDRFSGPSYRSPAFDGRQDSAPVTGSRTLVSFVAGLWPIGTGCGTPATGGGG